MIMFKIMLVPTLHKQNKIKRLGFDLYDLERKHL